ncbi:porin [Caldimonas sp. KR1-144]|uniref:porin n=1 Tax=Caldimonas sp. KR1-144 TaxID=3400911 RepID=UPI003C121FA5
MMTRVLPVLAGAAFGQAASAQSNVAIFGTVDLGIRGINNSGSGTFKSVGNQGNLANRLGFKCEEDLGGGLKASFHIETGILPDTGESLGQSFGIGFWNRQATVRRRKPVRSPETCLSQFFRDQLFERVGKDGLWPVAPAGIGGLAGLWRLTARPAGLKARGRSRHSCPRASARAAVLAHRRWTPSSRPCRCRS